MNKSESPSFFVLSKQSFFLYAKHTALRVIAHSLPNGQCRYSKYRVSFTLREKITGDSKHIGRYSNNVEFERYILWNFLFQINVEALKILKINFQLRRMVADLPTTQPP